MILSILCLPQTVTHTRFGLEQPIEQTGASSTPTLSRTSTNSQRNQNHLWTAAHGPEIGGSSPPLVGVVARNTKDPPENRSVLRRALMSILFWFRDSVLFAPVTHLVETGNTRLARGIKLYSTWTGSDGASLGGPAGRLAFLQHNAGVEGARALIAPPGQMERLPDGRHRLLPWGGSNNSPGSCRNHTL